MTLFFHPISPSLFLQQHANTHDNDNNGNTKLKNAISMLKQLHNRPQMKNPPPPFVVFCFSPFVPYYFLTENTFYNLQQLPSFLLHLLLYIASVLRYFCGRVRNKKRV